MNLRFSEKNPVVIGVVGVVVLVALVLGSLAATSLPFVGGTVYEAEFTEAGGLDAGDKVRVAGVEAGEIRDVALDGAKVVVSFTLKDLTPGDATRAAIKTQTLLGQRYLDIQSSGQQEMSSGDLIPLERTTAPYSVSEGIEDVTRTVGDVDLPKVSEALDTVSTTFRDTPDDVTATLDGLTRISETISSRDKALLDLLNNAEGTTSILRDRSAELTTILRDGNALLEELESRREVIRRLLANAETVFVQVRGLIDDNREQIGPVLDRTNKVLTLLRENEGNLTSAIERLGPFARSLGEIISSGPFFGAHIQNLNLGNVVPLESYLGSLTENAPPLGPGVEDEPPVNEGSPLTGLLGQGGN
ncbi:MULTISPECIES: MCE family protein [unclassified Pseudonocardia]|uniref:MCE family protein n=1 Tax=unclassified Pseudonocardia TaxID=2619320 RepID=UPI00094B16BC|nr:MULTISPECIES: MCE family protein [unclassified Pseudonocardia]